LLPLLLLLLLWSLTTSDRNTCRAREHQGWSAACVGGCGSIIFDVTAAGSLCNCSAASRRVALYGQGHMHELSGTMSMTKRSNSTNSRHR
jgi:hypothetical protein